MSAETATAAVGMDAMSRNEKRMWKVLQKFALEPVEDIAKVEIRRPKGPPVIVDAPRVYKVPGSTPSYVVLGPLRLHNIQHEIARTYQMFAQQQALARRAAAAEAAPEVAPAAEPEQADAEDAVDTAGLDEDDIKMAVEQTGKTKKVVVDALRAHNGDLVETIMALTA